MTLALENFINTSIMKEMDGSGGCEDNVIQFPGKNKGSMEKDHRGGQHPILSRHPGVDFLPKEGCVSSRKLLRGVGVSFQVVQEYVRKYYGNKSASSPDQERGIIIPFERRK